MKRRTGLALAGAALALAGVASWRGRPDLAPLVPTRWPELPVQTLEGRPQWLPAQTTRTRLVNLWARWCAPCRRELPSLQRLAARVEARNIQVLGLAIEDDLFALREYLASLSLSLPVWRLAPADSLTLEGSGTLPQTWLVAPDGRVLGRWAGERDWDQADRQHQLLAMAEGVAPW